MVPSKTKPPYDLPEDHSIAWQEKVSKDSATSSARYELPEFAGGSGHCSRCSATRAPSSSERFGSCATCQWRGQSGCAPGAQGMERLEARNV